MTLLKKVGLVILGALVILIVPAFLYGLLADADDPPSWLRGMTLLLLLLYIIGITIYLTAVLRHQRHG